jgi:hypothetical protein
MQTVYETGPVNLSQKNIIFMKIGYPEKIHWLIICTVRSVQHTV